MGQSGVVSYNVSNDALTVQDVTLRGTVTVESAGGHILSVEGAKVTAVPYFANKGKTVSVTTNDLGEYQIPLQPGRYTVYAENEVLNSAHISIMVNENIERNFELTECLDPPPPPPF